LTFSEREEIGLAHAGGESMRAIARRLGRSPSTISRELARTSDRAGGYRATRAHALAYVRASRSKPSKLATNMILGRKVENDLQKHYSPEQIVGRLRQEFPDDQEMRVSHETIYQSLYVQSRGALRRDLTNCLGTGRALRRPCRQPHQRKNQIPDMINIAERRAEADDRAVPDILRASLTWDQGIEMRDWQQVSAAADIDIYFSDPHAPWQRATSKNTNGLLRQYFPKGTDLSVHSALDLEWSPPNSTTDLANA
jgi:IS30 family transposase